MKKKTDPQILFCKYETSFLTCTTSKAINASNFVVFNFYLLLNILIYSNCFFFCYTVINNKRKAAFTSSLLSFHYILFSISIRFEISLKILWTGILPGLEFSLISSQIVLVRAQFQYVDLLHQPHFRMSTIIFFFFALDSYL